MRTLLILLSVLIFLSGLIAMVPLSFAMQASGVADRGISWSQARGTVWNGQLLGLRQAKGGVGDVTLKLKPASLLSGRLTHEAQWAGQQGRGLGTISVTPGRLVASDVRAEIDVAALDGFHDAMRQAGGNLRVRVDGLVMSNKGCEAASGTLATDTVQRLGTSYNRRWPELSGVIRCEGQALLLPLTGTGETGEQFRFESRLNPDGTLTTLLRAEGLDAEASLALMEYGFQPEGAGLVYREVQG